MANKKDFKLGPGFGISAHSLFIIEETVGSYNDGAVIISGGASIGKTLSLSGSLLLQNGSNFTALKSVASSNTIYTLPDQYPSTGTSVLQSNTSGTLSWAPMVASSGGDNYTVNVASSSGGTTLFVAGVNTSSGSGLAVSSNTNLTYNTTSNTLNSSFYSGTWAGSTITAFYGGTGYNSYTKGDILVGVGSTFIKLSVGTDNYVLTASSSTETGLTWSPAASTGLTTLNGLNTSIQYLSFDYSGTVPAFSSSGSTHTLNIPLASSGATGLVTSQAQTIGGAKTFADDTSITSATSSISSATGAFKVTGGVGIGGSLFAATSIAANSGANGLSLQKAVGASLGAVYSTNVSPSVSNYSLATDGNNLNLNSVSNLYLNISNTVKATLTTNNFAVNINVASSNSTSGAFTVSGGAGIAGSLYVGNASRFESSAASISSGTGALTATGGVGIGGSLYVGAASRFESSTASISSGTGALTVTGGVGIGGSLYVANASRFESNTSAISSSTGALTVTGGVGIGGSLYVVSPSRFESSTASISSGTGALTVSGGAGIAGSLFVANASRFESSTASVSTSTGALVVAGGVGIGGSLYVGSASRYSDTTQSLTTTSGALVVSGGVGIGQSVSIGGRLQIFNGANHTAFVSSATGNTVYTLPATSPATGTSILQSTSTGVMSWISPAGLGASSAGVEDGSVQYKVGSGFGATRSFKFDQNNYGLWLSDFPGLEPTDGTTAAIKIEQNYSSFNGSTFGTLLALNAKSGFAGDLVNFQVNSISKFRIDSAGAIGISGLNSWGDVNLTSTTNSTSSSNGALVVSGGVGIGKTLSVASNIQFNGTMYAGTNTFTKTLGAGDISLDNGSSDTPSITFYWGNNRNMGIDTYWAGSGSTRFRITKELNESGGAELWSVDRNGIVNRSAWDVGETINTRMYDYNELGMSATSTISSTSYTTIATISYTPKSSTSYLWIEFSCTYTISGSTADDFWSNIEVDAGEIVNSNQVWANVSGGGTRSGVMFPLAARYTNSNTTAKTITVRMKRGSSDDNATVYGNNASGYMRIQEIGR